MKTIKAICTQLTWLVLWVMISILFWGWIFTIITDTSAEHKVTIFIDAELRNAEQLAANLEKDLPDGITMVKVHPFSYAMMNSSALQNADIYIMKTSDVSQYKDWISESSQENNNLVYSEVNQISILDEYIQYESGYEYSLFWGAESVHVPENNGAVDSAAILIAEKILLSE